MTTAPADNNRRTVLKVIVKLTPNHTGAGQPKYSGVWMIAEKRPIILEIIYKNK